MDMVKETLKVHPIKRPLLNLIQPHKLYVRSREGSVFLFAGDKVLKMNTVVSHKIGMSIAALVQELEPDAIIELLISGQSIKMEPGVAMKVAGAILRKTDDADDYQLKQRRIVI